MLKNDSVLEKLKLNANKNIQNASKWSYKDINDMIETYLKGNRGS